MRLDRRVALITGAGRRLGRAMALGLAGQGVRVIVHYNQSAEPARETVALIERGGGQAIAVQADLRNISRLAYLVDAGIAAFGTVDILINSAAIFRGGTIRDTSEAEWDDHFAINLKAPFFLSQAFAERLVQGQRADIINIADWRVIRPGTKYLAYTLTKAGLVTLTRSLALALAPEVRVNAIAPGAVLPPPADDGDYFATIAGRLPVGHIGSPTDITQAVLYLLQADFVTGEVLYVTGGEHL